LLAAELPGAMCASTNATIYLERNLERREVGAGKKAFRIMRPGAITSSAGRPPGKR